MPFDVNDQAMVWTLAYDFATKGAAERSKLFYGRSLAEVDERIAAAVEHAIAEVQRAVREGRCRTEEHVKRLAYIAGRNKFIELMRRRGPALISRDAPSAARIDTQSSRSPSGSATFIQNYSALLECVRSAASETGARDDDGCLSPCCYPDFGALWMLGVLSAAPPHLRCSACEDARWLRLFLWHDQLESKPCDGLRWEEIGELLNPPVVKENTVSVRFRRLRDDGHVIRRGAVYAAMDLLMARLADLAQRPALLGLVQEHRAALEVALGLRMRVVTKRIVERAGKQCSALVDRLQSLRLPRLARLEWRSLEELAEIAGQLDQLLLRLDPVEPRADGQRIQER